MPKDSRPTPEPPPEKLGDRMARLRRARGWNQRELGERTGATSAQISKYERGSHAPRPDVLGRIAEALETTIDYLVTGREAKTRRDTRLRDLLPALESLPQGQRDNLVEFLRALLHAYHVLSLQATRRANSEPEARSGRGPRKSGKLAR